jgi:hypothetical protein
MTIVNNSSVALLLDYSVEVKDGSNVQQIEVGRVACSVNNVAGTVSQNTCTKVGNQQSVSNTPTSTLDLTFTITAANPALVQILANSSLTPSTGYPQLNMTQVNNMGSQAVVLQ